MITVKRDLAPRRRLPKTKKPLSLRRYEATVGFIFLLPWLLGFLLFKAIPILAALGFSFTNFNMLQPEQTQFVGLANYITFFKDTAAGASLFGSISYFILSVPLEMGVALALAAIFSSDRLKGKRIMRTLFFMPSIIPAIAIFIIISGLISPTSGWINRLIIIPLHLSRSLPLYNLFPIILSLWTIGPGFLIILGAMQAVPKELYEAARVDGAGPVNRFFSITLPMSSPAVFFALVINMISAFGGVALLDRGLSYSQSLSPMEGYISQQMFSFMRLGYASALAWVTFIVVMTITALLFRSARYWVHFPEERSDEEI
ncbi:MAG TPA: sugar ABC transporter permease [Anaerolineales bacterium]|nr:sugar ABC transporter permease [Anaerolineales bacterium]